MNIDRDLQSYDVMISSLITKMLRNNPSFQCDISNLQSVIKQRDNAIFSYLKASNPNIKHDNYPRQSQNQLYQITDKIKMMLNKLLRRFPDLHELYHQYLEIIEPIHHDFLNNHQQPFNTKTNFIKMQENLMNALKQETSKRKEAEEKTNDIFHGLQQALARKDAIVKDLENKVSNYREFEKAYLTKMNDKHNKSQQTEEQNNLENLKNQLNNLRTSLLFIQNQKQKVDKQLEQQKKQAQQERNNRYQPQNKKKQNILNNYCNFSDDIDPIKIDHTPKKKNRLKPPLPHQQNSFLTSNQISISQYPENDSEQWILPPGLPSNATKLTPYQTNKSPFKNKHETEGDQLWRFIYIQAITIEDQCIKKLQQSNLMQESY